LLPLVLVSLVLPGGFHLPNASAGAAVEKPDCPPSPKWIHTSGKQFDHRYPFRIWYAKPKDGDMAHTLGHELDQHIWRKETDLLQVEPRGRPLGSPLNICLVQNIDGSAAGDTIAIGCDRASSYILLLDSLDPVDARDVLAHEFFHTLQYALDVPCKNTYWWRESTGQWAETFVYPNDTRSTAYPHFYLEDVNKSLPDPTDLNKDREYGSFLFPLFIHHMPGLGQDVIGKIWRAAQHMPLLKAIDGNLPGGFKKQWPEFALRIFNHDPVTDLSSWYGPLADEGTFKDYVKTPTTLLPGSDVSLPVSKLPHLSADYYSFTVGAGVRTVSFQNQRPYSGGFRGKPDPNAKVQAIVSTNGGTSVRVADWTGKIGQAFCLALPEQQVSDLTLIFSNSGMTAEDDFNYGFKPHVVATNVGCNQWHGTITAERDDGGVVRKSTVSVTLARSASSPDDPLFYTPVFGSASWSISGTDGGGCTYSGSGTWTVGPTDGTLYLGWQLHSFGPVNNRAYNAAFGGPFYVDGVTVSCPGSDPDTGLSFWGNFPPWETSDINHPSPLVSADGTTLHGHFSATPSAETTVTWDWDLTSP
jgi:hypothetical protein